MRQWIIYAIITFNVNDILIDNNTEFTQEQNTFSICWSEEENF